jgi:hypothetical protein
MSRRRQWGCRMEPSLCPLRLNHQLDFTHFRGLCQDIARLNVNYGAVVSLSGLKH